MGYPSFTLSYIYAITVYFLTLHALGVVRRSPIHFVSYNSSPIHEYSDILTCNVFLFTPGNAMLGMMMISQFNGTSAPKGSCSAKTAVNYPLSVNKSPLEKNVMVK